MKKISKSKALELTQGVLSNDCWDMLLMDEDRRLTEEFVKKLVWNILLKLQNGCNSFGFEMVVRYNKARLHFDCQRVHRVSKESIQFKVINSAGVSTLSLSDDECTYVAESVSYLYDGFERIDEIDTITTLVSMINEAWYYLKKDYV